jgi:hypothetical protein
MKNKLKALFDNKATWLTIGVVATSLFGDEVGQGVNAFGLLVQAFL